MSIEIYTDGACRGNPGPMGIGRVIYKDGEEIDSSYSYVGDGTNNEAEYKAVLFAVKYLYLHKDIDYSNLDVVINSDSKLVVNQLKKEWDVNSERLRLYRDDILDITNKFNNVEFNHIRREKNKVADELANKALDER